MKQIDREQKQGLTDYKFFCFNDEPYCVQIDTGRYDGYRQNFYDMQWQSLGVHCSYIEGEGVRKPDGFEEMKALAAQLSKDFPFVRVDLYNVDGKVFLVSLRFILRVDMGSLSLKVLMWN